MFTPQYKSTKSSGKGRAPCPGTRHNEPARVCIRTSLAEVQRLLYSPNTYPKATIPIPSTASRTIAYCNSHLLQFTSSNAYVFTGIYAHISERFQLEILNFINRTEKPLPRKFQSSTSSLTVIFVAPMGTSKTVQLPKSINGENNFLGYMTTKGMWINQESTTEPILITASPYP